MQMPNILKSKIEIWGEVKIKLKKKVFSLYFFHTDVALVTIFAIVLFFLTVQVEVTKKQIYELKLEDGETHQRFSNNDSRR